MTDIMCFQRLGRVIVEIESTYAILAAYCSAVSAVCDITSLFIAGLIRYILYSIKACTMYEVTRLYCLLSSGPSRYTIDDFWRLVWQENVHVIVMATNLFEHARVRTTN